MKRPSPLTYASLWQALRPETPVPSNRVPEPRGETYEPARDRARLGQQYLAVVDAMRDGLWHTLAFVASAANAPEASASARLRDMRRDGWRVDRRRVGGTFEYRAVREAR